MGISRKTALITGGANGIGEAHVRALHAAGVEVFFGDVNLEAGTRLREELTSIHFIPCDVTKWEDQAKLFEDARRVSSTGKIHYVVANAGITRGDDVFTFDGTEKGPQKPDLSIVDVNLTSTLYTVKLALHYFIAQNGQDPSDSQEDTCLILTGSGASYLDVPRTPQYCSTKWGLRGIMHSLRRTASRIGSRVNIISPWYIRTRLMPKEIFDTAEAAGVEFADAGDAADCLLHILKDPSINGSSFLVVPRKWSSTGYKELEVDNVLPDELLQDIQELLLSRRGKLAGPIH